MVRLPNILFNQIFTSFSCARQNVAKKMEIIAGELPIGLFGIAEISFGKCRKVLDFMSFHLIAEICGLDCGRVLNLKGAARFPFRAVL